MTPLLVLLMIQRPGLMLRDPTPPLVAASPEPRPGAQQAREAPVQQRIALPRER